MINRVVVAEIRWMHLTYESSQILRLYGLGINGFGSDETPRLPTFIVFTVGNKGAQRGTCLGGMRMSEKRQ